MIESQGSPFGRKPICATTGGETQPNIWGKPIEREKPPVGDPGRTPIDPLQPLINPVDLFLVEPILLKGRRRRRRMGWDGCVSI